MCEIIVEILKLIVSKAGSAVLGIDYCALVVAIRELTIHLLVCVTELRLFNLWLPFPHLLTTSLGLLIGK